MSYNGNVRIAYRRLALIAAATTLIGSVLLALGISFARRPSPSCGCAPANIAGRLEGPWKVEHYVQPDVLSTVGEWNAFTLDFKKNGDATLTNPSGSGGSGFWSAKGPCLHLELMVTDYWYKKDFCATLSADGQHLQITPPLFNRDALFHRVKPK